MKSLGLRKVLFILNIFHLLPLKLLEQLLSASRLYDFEDVESVTWLMSLTFSNGHNIPNLDSSGRQRGIGGGGVEEERQHFRKRFRRHDPSPAKHTPEYT